MTPFGLHSPSAPTAMLGPSWELRGDSRSLLKPSRRLAAGREDGQQRGEVSSLLQRTENMAESRHRHRRKWASVLSTQPMDPGLLESAQDQYSRKTTYKTPRFIRSQNSGFLLIIPFLQPAWERLGDSWAPYGRPLPKPSGRKGGDEVEGVRNGERRAQRVVFSGFSLWIPPCLVHCYKY